MESEFIALIATSKKVEWLRNILLDIKLWPQPMLSISIYYDSQAIMSRAFNKIYNKKSRHVSLRYEYIWQLIFYKIITILYIRSYNNLTYPFHKGFSWDLVRNTFSSMSLKPFH